MEKINPLTLSWQHCRIDMILFWISDQVCASKDFQCFYSPAILNNLLCFSNLSSNPCLCFGVFFTWRAIGIIYFVLPCLVSLLKLPFFRDVGKGFPFFTLPQVISDCLMTKTQRSFGCLIQTISSKAVKHLYGPEPVLVIEQQQHQKTDMEKVKSQ